jgi:hypothetical protein
LRVLAVSVTDPVTFVRVCLGGLKTLNLNSPSMGDSISGILMRKIRSLLVLIVNRSVGSAHATEISGIPEVADGDTVVISGTKLRLLHTRSYRAPADPGRLDRDGARSW